MKRIKEENKNNDKDKDKNNYGFITANLLQKTGANK